MSVNAKNLTAADLARHVADPANRGPGDYSDGHFPAPTAADAVADAVAKGAAGVKVYWLEHGLTQWQIIWLADTYPEYIVGYARDRRAHKVVAVDDRGEPIGALHF